MGGRKSRCESIDPRIIEGLSIIKQNFGKLNGEQLEKWLKKYLSQGYFCNVSFKDTISITNNKSNDVIQTYIKAYKKGLRIEYYSLDKQERCEGPKDAIYDVIINQKKGLYTVVYGATYVLPAKDGPTRTYKIQTTYDLRYLQCCWSFCTELGKSMFFLPPIQYTPPARTKPLTMTTGQCQICGKLLYDGQVNEDYCPYCKNRASFQRYGSNSYPLTYMGEFT